MVWRVGIVLFQRGIFNREVVVVAVVVGVWLYRWGR